jgi:hypothetical protein
MLLVGFAATLISGCAPAHRDTTAAPRTSQAAASVPVPQSYAETCRLVGSWCEPVAGSVPAKLRRPLHLPHIGAGQRCPTSSGQRFANDQFSGIVLGRGPVRPLISANGGDPRHGALPFVRLPRRRSLVAGEDALVRLSALSGPSLDPRPRARPFRTDCLRRGAVVNRPAAATNTDRQRNWRLAGMAWRDLHPPSSEDS